MFRRMFKDNRSGRKNKPGRRNQQQRAKLASELYLIKEWEVRAAKKLKHIFYDLGAWRASWKNVHMEEWNQERHSIKLNREKNRSKINRVIFSQHRYLPDVNYKLGKPVIIKDQDITDAGWVRELDLRNSSDGGMLSVHEGVTLIRGVEHRFDAEVRFDVTSRTTVSGSYGGAEVEQELEIAFGTTVSAGDTKTEAKNMEQSLDLDLPVKAGEGKLITLERNKIITETPFSVNGVLDCRIKFDFEDWAGSNRKDITGKLLWRKIRGGKEIEFDSLLALEQFLYGYDVKYPEMAAFPSHCSNNSTKAMDWLFNHNNRFISASGVKRREFENHAAMRVHDL